MDLNITCLNEMVGWKPTANDCVPGDFSPFEGRPLNYNDIPGLTLTNLYLATRNRDGSRDEDTFVEYLTNHSEDTIKQVLIDLRAKVQSYIRGSSLTIHGDIGYRPRSGRPLLNSAGRFVFVSIKPKDSANEYVQIPMIEVWTEQPVEDLTIYVYSDSQIAPITSFTINTNEATALSDLKLDLDTTEARRNQNYYIGYYEADLGGVKAMSMESGCDGCSPEAPVVKGMKLHTGYMIGADTYVDKTRPDFDKKFITDGESYGINLRLTVGCDLTPTICDNPEQFAALIQKKGASIAFWSIWPSNSVDSSVVNQKLNAQAMAEKLELDYEKELKRISLDLSGLDCRCFQERNFLGTLPLRRS